MNIKKKLILIGSFLFIAIFVVGFFIYQRNAATKMSPEDLARYESVYHEYPVQYLRRALDGYVANNFDGICMVPPAILASDGKKLGFEDSLSGLSAFDEVYYKSKFIVWSYNDNKENGKDIMILFRDKPDRLFYAWVGRDLGGEICLLGFNSRDIDKKVLKNTIKTLKPSIYDERYGI